MLGCRVVCWDELSIGRTIACMFMCSGAYNQLAPRLPHRNCTSICEPAQPHVRKRPKGSRLDRFDQLKTKRRPAHREPSIDRSKTRGFAWPRSSIKCQHDQSSRWKTALIDNRNDAKRPKDRLHTKGPLHPRVGWRNGSVLKTQTGETFIYDHARVRSSSANKPIDRSSTQVPYMCNDEGLFVS